MAVARVPSAPRRAVRREVSKNGPCREVGFSRVVYVNPGGERVLLTDVAVPKLREGSYFPDWLVQRRRRSEAGLTSVVATYYLLGVTTRRMDKLVPSLGLTGLSTSQVSEMAKDLDEQVEQFRTRPLTDGPHTFVAADALMIRVREGGRVVKVAGMVATGVNGEGYPFMGEILGIHTTTTGSTVGWLAFFRDLIAAA